MSVKNKKFRNRRELAIYVGTLNPSIAVEIGVRRGLYSKFILDNTDVKKLYSIDPWIKNEELSDPEEAYYYCEYILRPYGNRSQMIKASSPEISSIFLDNSIDFVYIDGLHDYDSVKKDLESWYPKVKLGGVISGHDYTIHWPGVFSAVQDFTKQKNYEINTTDVILEDDIFKNSNGSVIRVPKESLIEDDSMNPSWWFVKK